MKLIIIAICLALHGSYAKYISEDETSIDFPSDGSVEKTSEVDFNTQLRPLTKQVEVTKGYRCLLGLGTGSGGQNHYLGYTGSPEDCFSMCVDHNVYKTTAYNFMLFELKNKKCYCSTGMKTVDQRSKSFMSCFMNPY